MTALSRVARSASARLLFSRKKLSRDDLPELLTIAQLNSFLALEKTFPRHPLEARGLIFDRLLLTSSAHYRKTRSLAAKLGIRMVPRPVPLNRKLEQFDPRSGDIAFSPLKPPIRLENWKKLRKYSASVYHDLNHAILFRLLRPDPSVWSDPERALEYFSLVESLVVLRDAQMSIELGAGLVPLYLLGTVYSKPRQGEEKVSGPENFAWFRAHTLTTHALLQGMPPERARRMIGGPRLSTTNQEFVRITHRRWAARYRSRFNPGLGIPPVPRGWARHALVLKELDPRKLAGSRAEMARLHAWFGGWF